MQMIFYHQSHVLKMSLWVYRHLILADINGTLEEIRGKELLLLTLFMSRHDSYNVFIKIIKFKCRKHAIK